MQGFVWGGIALMLVWLVAQVTMTITGPFLNMLLGLSVLLLLVGLMRQLVK